MVKSKVIRWGNSLAIKLPKSVRDIMSLENGDELNIYVTDKNEMVINKSGLGNDVFDSFKVKGKIIGE